MLPDRVSNPGPLTYESGALLTAQYIKKTQLGGLDNQFVLISISKKKKSKHSAKGYVEPGKEHMSMTYNCNSYS